MTRIAIVGAGLCGRLLAINLLRQAKSPVSIVMLDRGHERHMGPAYSDDADYLLLNVPAGRMGALAEDPGHFLMWLRQKGIRAGESDFVPRGLYRNYVFDLLQQAQSERLDAPRLTHKRTEVLDIATSADCVTLHSKPAQNVVVDKAVLALGNFAPRHPRIANRAALAGSRYVRNPWHAGVFDRLSPRDAVFLIGTGQTMVDLALTLHNRGHRGSIVAISRRGALAMAHRGFEAYPSFFKEIRGSKRLLDIVKAVRRHMRRAQAAGIDIRAVIDSLRPDTQALWCGLPDAEKRRFMRHVLRYWEIIRSRLPPQNDALIAAMRKSGALRIVAGQVFDLIETPDAMAVHYRARGDDVNQRETAALVINCMGPETNCALVDDLLVTNLMSRGVIRPGPADLGIDARRNGAIIDRDGHCSNVLYTLGSTMRGVLWEVLAVPDIRVQAQQLAHTLLANNVAC